MSLGVITLAFDLIIAHPAIADPYKWSMVQNVLYWSLVRFSFTAAFPLITFPIFIGYGSIFKSFATSPLVLACAKAVFIVSLIFPMVISLYYNTT